MDFTPYPRNCSYSPLHKPPGFVMIDMPYVMLGLVRFHGVNPVRSGRKQQ